MLTNSGYAAYANNKVMTASKADLTLMLYEGAIKFCNIAITAIEEKDIPKAHNNIVKVQKIIDHLRATLDMKYPVAKEFDNIYEYLIHRLISANVKKDVEILNEILEHLRSVRDTWKEVMRISREKGTV